MAFNEMDGLQQLSQLEGGGGTGAAPPTGGGLPNAGPVGPTPNVGGGLPTGGPPTGGSTQGMGGPGIDTPQEQQAMQLLTQGAQSLREASNVDPSIRYIIDKVLMDGFSQIMKHYGLEEQGKVALQQAQLQKRDQDTLRRAPTGPPTGGGQPVVA